LAVSGADIILGPKLAVLRVALIQLFTNNVPLIGGELKCSLQYVSHSECGAYIAIRTLLPPGHINLGNDYVSTSCNPSGPGIEISKMAVCKSTNAL
jgi:hypothetical protein